MVLPPQLYDRHKRVRRFLSAIACVFHKNQNSKESHFLHLFELNVQLVVGLLRFGRVLADRHSVMVSVERRCVRCNSLGSSNRGVCYGFGV